METPLTPLDFARRTRRLHGFREAVVDGSVRLSYAEFFDRRKAVAIVGERPKTAAGKIQEYVLRGGAAGIGRQ